MKHKLYWLISLIIVYIILVLAVPFIQDTRMNIAKLNFNSLQDDGVSFGDSVSFLIERPKIYGVIIQDAIESKLYLFNFLPIPLARQGFNFFYLHLPFLGIFCFIMLKGGLNKDEQIASSHTPSYPDWSYRNNDFDANEYKSTSYSIWN